MRTLIITALLLSNSLLFAGDFEMDFSTSLRTFLNAVSSKDCETAYRFVAKKSPIRVILPDGRLITNFEDFVKSQVSWFESKEGKFSYDIIDEHSNEEKGWAVIEAKLEIGGAIKKINISFVFTKVDNEWLMVYDQNTLLQ